MLGSLAAALPQKPAQALAFRRLMRTMPLADAARQIYLDAKNEALPIAIVAEREAAHDSPTRWIADSMLQIVPVYRKVDGRFEHLDSLNRRETLEGLLGRVGAALDELHVRRRDCRAYLRWARTVQ